MKVTSGSTATVHVDRKANRDRQAEKNGRSEISVVADAKIFLGKLSLSGKFIFLLKF